MAVDHGLEGKTVLITGAAGGIGIEVAIVLWPINKITPPKMVP